MAPLQFEAPATIPVPSADLINYRFDQSDKKFEEMNNKLDQILIQNSHFVEQAEVQRMIDATLKPTQDTLTNWRWYWRALFTAMVIASGTAIVGIWSHHG